MGWRHVGYGGHVGYGAGGTGAHGGYGGVLHVPEPTAGYLC